MNSERRHELQQNDLAIWLNKINKSVEPYTKPIAIVLGLLVVGGLALGFYRSEQMAERSEATLQLIQAAAGQDAEVLMAVSDTYPNTEAGEWARLYQGQLLLSQGIQSLFNDRENAEVLLKDAQQALRAAISSSKETLLLSRGQYGIAQAAEALGNLDEAIEAYKKVVEIKESDAMVEKAQERIDILSKPEAQAFVTWFSDQDFSPPDPSMPPSLPSGNQLPEMPDLTLPPLDLGGGDDAAPRDLEGGIELPKEGAEAADQEAATAPTEAASESTEGSPESTEAAPENTDASDQGPASEAEATEPESAAPASTESPAEPESAPAEDASQGSSDPTETGDEGPAEADETASDEESSES